MVCKNCGMQLREKDKFCQKCGTPVSQQEKAIANEKQKKSVSPILTVIISGVIVIALAFIMWAIAKKDIQETIVRQENTNVVLDDANNNYEEPNKEQTTTDYNAEPVMDENSANSETSNQNETEQESVQGKYDELQNGNYEELAHSLKTGEKVQSSHREIMMSMLNALLADQKIGCDEKICFNQLSGEESQYYARSIIKNNMLQIEGDYEDGGVLYNKAELNKAVWEFYYGGEVQWKPDQILEDHGDYIKYYFADGEPWIGLYTCDIRENGDFYLVSGPCFYGDNGGTENIFEFYIDAVFEKNEESRYGVTLCYLETYKEGKFIDTIAATSSLADYKDKSYGSDKLIDGDEKTPWVEGVDGTGEGEQITIHLSEPTNVYGILLYNGYLESDDLHAKNGIVTRVSVDFGKGVVVKKDVEDLTYYVEYPAPDKIELEQSVMTDEIVITILGAQPGTKYDDTCIGEIIVY